MDDTTYWLNRAIQHENAGDKSEARGALELALSAEFFAKRRLVNPRPRPIPSHQPI